MNLLSPIKCDESPDSFNKIVANAKILNNAGLERLTKL